MRAFVEKINSLVEITLLYIIGALYSQDLVGHSQLEQVGQFRRVQLTLQKVHFAVLDLHQAVGDLQLQVFYIQIRGVVFEHLVTLLLIT